MTMNEMSYRIKGMSCLLHKFWITLAVSFFVSAPHASAQGINSTCDSYPDIPVNITPVFEDPRYDFTADIASIQGMAHDTRRSIRESLTLGLTRYEPMLEFRLPIKGVTFPDGLSCAYVTNAEVRIGYRNVTVYIAREIPRDSCGFDEIMAHEQKHIAVNRQVLHDYAPLIREKLHSYLKLNGVFRQQKADYALKLLHEKLQIIINDLSAQMMKDNEERQRQVDGLDEYRRITTSCNGQMAFIGQHFRHSH